MVETFNAGFFKEIVMKKTQMKLFSIGLFGLQLACPIVSFAAESTLRCEKGIVSVGDEKTEAKQKCGKPTGTDKSTIPKNRSKTGKAIKVEEWTYNFGPQKFMKRLRFENGKLRDVESLGYGN
jgi:hypothetical protein